MIGEVKVSYFNARGRAEMTRLLLKLAGKEFVDYRFDFEDWKEKYEACK